MSHFNQPTEIKHNSFHLAGDCPMVVLDIDLDSRSEVILDSFLLRLFSYPCHTLLSFDKPSRAYRKQS